MAVPEELTGFVKEALGKRIPRSEIEAALRAAGWAPEPVESALAGFAAVDFPVPVPRPHPYLSAREAFLYLLLFITLYITAFNLGSLCFQLINRAFPDPAASSWEARSILETIRWAVASIVVAFPIFLSLSWHLGRGIRRDPTKRASKVRKWLTYLTLLVAAGVLIGDLISLLGSFLAGDLTTRFLLKVLTVAVIAGTVFAYYLWDLRADERDAK